MFKWYVAPSNQEKNTGSNGYVEEIQMNLVADAVIRHATRQGVFQLFRNNPNATLAQNVADANSKTAAGDIYTGIHSNAGGGRGCEVHAYAPGTNSDKLAQIIFRRLSAITPSADRRVWYDNLIEVRDTKACAVLIEVAFHDNPDDANWIVNNTDLIGEEIVKAVCEFKGVAYIPEQAPSFDPVYMELEAAKKEIERLEFVNSAQQDTISNLNTKLNNALDELNSLKNKPEPSTGELITLLISRIKTAFKNK